MSHFIEDELEMDESAYEMYHQAQTNAPCLSFDVILDDYGNNRTEYPHKCFLVAGTQSENSTQNNIIIMKLSNLKKTFKENNDMKSDSESESDEDEDEKPEFESATITHSGCINRIRCTDFSEKRFAASWSEIGKVFIWELNEPISAVSDARIMTDYVKKSNQLPIFQFNGHQEEGFAIDWSQLIKGQLATGDCSSNIHVWKIENDKRTWNVDQRPLLGHKSSVEDIQWSPNEATVFASCSTDKSIRIWDIRAPSNKANMLTCNDAHNSDVNVINWNRKEPFIASGGDDCYIKIWDLRLLDQNKPVAIFKHHTKPITSIEWNINDSTVFASSSEDNQLTIWDLAVEKDEKIETQEQIDDEYPQQLLFIHQGQKEMKELHWHPQIPGLLISTAHTGFNIFKTISV